MLAPWAYSIRILFVSWCDVVCHIKGGIHRTLLHGKHFTINHLHSQFNQWNAVVRFSLCWLSEVRIEMWERMSKRCTTNSKQTNNNCFRSWSRYFSFEHSLDKQTNKTNTKTIRNETNRPQPHQFRTQWLNKTLVFSATALALMHE